MKTGRDIDCAAAMVAAVRREGIVPLFRSAVPGWSIEDQTAPGCWFTEGDDLGPWDWKVDVVREGDIAYGKFLGGKAAFATVPCYRLLMTWRRSLVKLQPSDPLSATAIEAIRKAGAMESGELRRILGVRKAVCDRVLQFLQTGTWCVTGDITRVYRGPDLHYSGWQRASFTTPEALFGSGQRLSEGPSWARRFEAESAGAALEAFSPDQAREQLFAKVTALHPQAERRTLERII